VLGAALGNMATNIGSLLDSPQARDMILRLGGRHGLTDSFLAAELGFVGVFVTAYGVQAVLRLRSEEAGVRAEPVLATAVSRLRWLGSHLLVALAGSAVLLAVTGLAAGVTAGSAADSSVGHEVGRLVGAALAQLPAVWLVVGLTLAAYGLAPRLAVVGWAALVAFLLLGELGPLFRFNHWVMDLSPYAHVPRLPGGSLAPLSMGALAAVALALLVAGALGFRRRDVG
jgi:ABC-2 type transport system permease protein